MAIDDGGPSEALLLGLPLDGESPGEYSEVLLALDESGAATSDDTGPGDVAYGGDELADLLSGEGELVWLTDDPTTTESGEEAADSNEGDLAVETGDLAAIGVEVLPSDEAPAEEAPADENGPAVCGVAEGWPGEEEAGPAVCGPAEGDDIVVGGGEDDEGGVARIGLWLGDEVPPSEEDAEGDTGADGNLGDPAVCGPPEGEEWVFIDPIEGGDGEVLIGIWPEDPNDPAVCGITDGEIIGGGYAEGDPAICVMYPAVMPFEGDVIV